MRKGRFFAAHLGLLAAFLLLSVAGWLLLVAIDSLVFTGHVAAMNFRFVAFKLFNDVLIYGTLAGVAYAWHNADAVAKAEALRARASLEAMRSQLNPHFILNTFHALVGLVRRDPAVAESALEQLGDLLRYSLRVQRDGIDEVPLRDEYALVESYLELERLRLADRLRVTVELPPPTLECLVPTFAVQILVENAVRHAIAPRAAGGRLEIRAVETDGRLCITVKDDGNGSSTNALAADGAAVDGQTIDAWLEGSRMGLRLLHERLAALYGNQAALTLRSSATETCASLTLPARRTSEDER
jgi:LytS/YehU family sensor histidine kinase